MLILQAAWWERSSFPLDRANILQSRLYKPHDAGHFLRRKLTVRMLRVNGRCGLNLGGAEPGLLPRESLIQLPDGRGSESGLSAAVDLPFVSHYILA